jgi:hypothetical protein
VGWSSISSIDLKAKYADATAYWHIEGSLIIGIKNVLEVSYRTLMGDFFSDIKSWFQILIISLKLNKFKLSDRQNLLKKLF